MVNIPLVSIIIPTYNTGDYIAKMLEGVFRQTYSNYEVIVVDDGSTDDTVAIVKNIVGGKIKLIELPHGGVSAARNAGIECAKGEKIFFWDSDDTMELTTIADCLEFSEKHNVNAVLYGYANKQNGIKGRPHGHELREEYRGHEIVEELMPHFLGHSFSDINYWICGKKGLRQGKEHTALWRIMLDAQTIKDNGLRFDPSLSLGEDTRFINEYFLYETSVGFLDKCLYYLTIRESGANLLSLNNAAKRLQDKLKLVAVRKEIDRKAKAMHNVDTHSYWEGTLVLSVVEMAIRLSANKTVGFKQNYKLFKSLVDNEAVNKAVLAFRPAFGLKALPFVLMKYCGCTALFVLCSLLPNKIAKHIY